MILNYSAKFNNIKEAIHMPHLKMSRFGPFIEIMGIFLKAAGLWNSCPGKFSTKMGSEAISQQFHRRRESRKEWHRQGPQKEILTHLRAALDRLLITPPSHSRLRKDTGWVGRSSVNDG